MNDIQRSPPSPEVPTMTNDIELLPLPDWMMDLAFSAERIRKYARACIAHATAAKDAEIEALRETSDTLTQQPAAHTAITHCDNCGCDWLDNGLNPIGCPYCKRPAAVDVAAVAIKSAIAELDALRNAMFKTYAAAANGADKTKLIRLIEAERDAYEAHYSLPKLQAALSAQPGDSNNDR